MIPIAEPCLGEEELKNVTEALKSGWISSKGKFIEEFEEKISSYCGRKYGVATSNGTVALHLALKTLGIGKGDEIIIPDLTFVAVANTVTYCNAKPIFIDSHPDYWCIDPEKIEEKTTPKTKAIIPVHLYGHPCDMDPILDIANDHDLYVIEDAAEAHGAEYKGRKVGSFGDISCFSFYGNKIITTGEGGMCLTNNEELAEKMKILRDHGMNPNKRYWYDVIGFNYRMTNLQAAVGVAQLKKLDEFVEKKRKIAKRYSEELKDLEEKELITLHPEMPWAKCVYWMYCILIEDKFGMSRDELMKRLEENGIDTRPFFYPVHVMPPYKNNEGYPVAEEISRKGINLPSGVSLKEEEIKFICNEIKKELED
ncbi:Aspartate aminotransferase [ANME-1 cluster archaeon GoMg1]|nr:Aspartate aminotransferase [ANME-1 cluster archaeon GoMg1]